MVSPSLPSRGCELVQEYNRFGAVVEDYHAVCKRRCVADESDPNPVRDSLLKTMIRLFVDLGHVEFNCRVMQQVTTHNPRRLIGPDEAPALDLHNDISEYTRLSGFARAGLLGFAKCKWYSPNLGSNRTRIHKAIAAMINFMTEGLFRDELREYEAYTQDCIEHTHCAPDLSQQFLRILAEHRMDFFAFFNSTQFAAGLDGPTLMDYLTMTGKYDTDQLTRVTNSFVHCIQWFTERYRTYVSRAVCGKEIACLVSQILHRHGAQF